MDDMQGPFALWSLFASAFISATLAPGGSEAVLAYLAHQARHEPQTLLFIATLGNTLGGVTTWLLGRLAAFRYPADSLARNHLKAVGSVRRYGDYLLLLSWLPVVGDGFCFAAGWLRLSFWWSLAAMAIGKGLRYGLIVYAFI
ncbi:YqaA family protein [Fluviicoccus sp.]|uniref:YqaA family protein n=1 Tax=Fluviicoccus sp. TaxID=2003552 RepID=UPI00351DD665